MALPDIAGGRAEPAGCGLAPAISPTSCVHDPRRAAARCFYDDLLRGRTVLIHFFSIAAEPDYRSIANLAQVQAAPRRPPGPRRLPLFDRPSIRSTTRRGR